MAAYDGYAPGQALDSLARLGVSHAEPAYRYCGAPFDEASFASTHAKRLGGAFKAAGLHCSAVFADLDLVDPQATSAMQRRLEFVATVGGQLLILPAPPKAMHRIALTHLMAVAPQVEALALKVALSPCTEAGPLALPDVADFVASAQLPWLGLNFSTAQALQAQPGLPVADQFDAVAMACVHMHLGDVRVQDGWFPVPLGDGHVACADVLHQIEQHPLPLTLDLPLRQYRSRTGQARRAPYRPPLADIEKALSNSLRFVSKHLSSHLLH